MSNFSAADLIIKKRDGLRLEDKEIDWLVRGYTSGEIADYQMSAFLMAGFLNGLDADETYALTHSMLHSGTVVDLSMVQGKKVDKHSTGGVGDKISIVLAPIVAACGVPVPMISGRGLGHTGGTLDKLEAIPGFNVNLSTEEYREVLSEIGLVMIGQTDDIAPADRGLYALRDVTGTVEHIPYIASSIMSKKLAEGIDALVLDVKCGRGAFMKSETDARRLAETLVGIGEAFEKQTVALLTRMDAPLGYAVGNWLETYEAIRCLHGDEVPEVTDITLALAAEMIWMGGVASTTDEGKKLARQAIESGAALEIFARLVERQGGDAEVVYKPETRTNSNPAGTIVAPDDGYITDIDALEVGKAALFLGAGRLRKEDAVDPLAGIVFLRKPGEHVEKGEPVAELFTQRTGDRAAIQARVRDAMLFSPEAPPKLPIVMDRFEDGSWESGGRRAVTSKSDQ